MNTIRSLAVRAPLVAMTLALLGVGCGKNRVVLEVDVLSFMDPASTTTNYDAPPLVTTTDRSEPITVQLLEGYDDLGHAVAARLDVQSRYDNQTGTGRGRVRVYMGPDATTVYDTVPVAVLEADLAPAQTTYGDVVIEADQRVLDLFTGRSFYVGVESEWVPSGTQALQGTSTLTRIHAHVESTMDLF